jgi:hypothetical protein
VSSDNRLRRVLIVSAISMTSMLAWAGSASAHVSCGDDVGGGQEVQELAKDSKLLSNTAPPLAEKKPRPAKLMPSPPVQATYVDVSCPRTLDVIRTTAQPATQQTTELTPVANQGLKRNANGELRWIEGAAMAVLLAIAAFLSLLGMAWLISSGLKGVAGSLLFRRHWGGFGGDTSGWNVSAPLGRCCGGLILLVIGAGLSLQTLSVMHDHAEDRATEQGKDAPEKPAEAPDTDAGQPLSPEMPSFSAQSAKHE